MSLHNLPLDILHALCAFLDTSSLLNLSRTHSVFYPYTQRNIYRHVAISSLPNAVRCIKTLHNNPDFALFVRSFSLRIDANAALLGAFVDNLASVLVDMSNLASLDLVLPPAASRVLASSSPRLARLHPDRSPSYHRLSRFSSNFGLDASLCTFLARTPALKELQLGDAAATTAVLPLAQPAASPLPVDALPNLALFTGSCSDATIIVPGRPLESVHLYSGDLDEAVLDALARSSTPITIFGSLTNSLSPSILHALASSLPHLQHLRIMTMYHSSNHPGDVSYIHRPSTLLPLLSIRFLLLVFSADSSSIHSVPFPFFPPCSRVKSMLTFCFSLLRCSTHRLCESSPPFRNSSLQNLQGFAGHRGRRMRTRTGLDRPGVRRRPRTLISQLQRWRMAIELRYIARKRCLCHWNSIRPRRAAVAWFELSCIPSRATPSHPPFKPHSGHSGYDAQK